jgi:phage gp29-like protein
MKLAIVNINIQIPVPDNATEEEAKIIAENVEDSFEFIKMVEE